MSDGVGAPQGRPRKYTDAELVAALREVREASEYGGLSKRVYQAEKREGHPSARTVEKWLGSWRRARRLAEVDDD